MFNKIKEYIIGYFKGKITDKLKLFGFIKNIVLYIVSIVIIVYVLRFFGFFKDTPVKPPITPGNVTVVTKPSKDNTDKVLNGIQKQRDLLKGKLK